MSAKATTIELNGKRYDARTGKIIPAQEKVAVGTKEIVKPVTKKPGVAIDGFTRRKPAAPRPKTTAHAVHKKTEKSKTLMRTAVKKPDITKTKLAPAPRVTHHRQAPHITIDPKRATRAEKVQKSAFVSRFGVPQKTVKPIPAALPVRPEPTAPPVSMLGEHHKPTLSPKKTAHQKSFQKAIDSATSHSQPRPKKTTKRQRLSRKLHVSTRTMNVAAASLATVLLAGFIAYQNVPNLSMRVAAARAGVKGTLPDYQPAGFGLAGPIKYQQGQITLNYASNSDARQFQVNQKATDWNSDTLLENFVAVGQKTYQTFQDSGKTIYIYDDNNATWVDGGVWYRIEGSSALSSDQLLRMAASM